MTDSDDAVDEGTDAPPPDAAVRQADAVQTSRPLRVLVADDVDIVRELLRRMLEKLGHVVDEVTDGQQAVEAVAAGDYDLLLLDLSMPKMSGIDVARWLNAHPEHAGDLKVVIVSASARDERPILNELGISLFLPKPIRRQELADLLDGLHR